MVLFYIFIINNDKTVLSCYIAEVIAGSLHSHMAVVKLHRCISAAPLDIFGAVSDSLGNFFEFFKLLKKHNILTFFQTKPTSHIFLLFQARLDLPEHLSQDSTYSILPHEVRL